LRIFSAKEDSFSLHILNISEVTLRSSQDECDGAPYARGGPYQGQYGTYDTGLFVVCLGLAKFSKGLVKGSIGLTNVCIGLIKSIQVFYRKAYSVQFTRFWIFGFCSWINFRRESSQRASNSISEFDKISLRGLVLTRTRELIIVRPELKANTIVSYVV
jgi:hypothetical protein